MAASGHLFRNEAGEKTACAGIDIQSPFSTPSGKLFGVDEDAHHGLSEANRLLLATFGLYPPEVIVGVELRAVAHDRHAGIVFLCSVPGDADDMHAVESLHV